MTKYSKKFIMPLSFLVMVLVALDKEAKLYNALAMCVFIFSFRYIDIEKFLSYGTTRMSFEDMSNQIDTMILFILFLYVALSCNQVLNLF